MCQIEHKIVNLYLQSNSKNVQQPQIFTTKHKDAKLNKILKVHMCRDFIFNFDMKS